MKDSSSHINLLLGNQLNSYSSLRLAVPTVHLKMSKVLVSVALLVLATVSVRATILPGRCPVVSVKDGFDVKQVKYFVEFSGS